MAMAGGLCVLKRAEMETGHGAIPGGDGVGVLRPLAGVVTSTSTHTKYLSNHRLRGIPLRVQHIIHLLIV